MESPDTFTLLPIAIDPITKQISTTERHPSTALTSELASLNLLHRSLVALDAAHNLPPPPVPVNPKRSAQVSKLRDAANAALSTNKPADSIRMYSLAIEMASSRPAWEPAVLVRDELSLLYSNRAQAYMGQQSWAEAAIDALCSVELKKVQNAKAWWRRGRCLLEMGRVEEAAEWVAEALQFEGAGEGKLVALMREVDAVVEKKGRR